MKILNQIIALLSITILLSCGYSEEFNEVNHNNEFVISFPDYMKSCNDFQADLEYKNAYRNTYSLVKVYEKESMTLEDFQRKTLGVLKAYKPLTKPLVTDSTFRENENFKAIDVQLYGTMDGENIYYWHSVFESKGKFYEVVCWTRSMDRKQRYGADLAKIITSFKPLI
ncbi:MAG: hypothetical protein WD512_03050 [Candidatus Paceibacterota bacterium]